MTKAELDYILGTMLDSNKNVSDVNITVDKPLQVESSGELVAVAIEPRVEKLTPFQTETIALNIINRNRRLTEDLIKSGSCDCSYSLGQKARFRVNIFTQRGHYTTILRKLSTEIPSVDQLNLPPVFHTIAREKTGLVLVTAETGHLVMSTLHTINAGQTINRIVGMFDQAEEQQIRIRLAETVRWIVSQRLLPRVGGGRVAALEIMGNNLRVKDAIEHGESEGKTFYEIIEAASAFGWKTFDMAILELFEQGLITEENAVLYCTNKGVVTRGIDRIKKPGGSRRQLSPASPSILDTGRKNELFGKSGFF